MTQQFYIWEYIQKPKTLIQKNMSTICHCSIIYNRQDLEPSQVPIGRWEDKTDMATFKQLNFPCS